MVNMSNEMENSVVAQIPGPLGNNMPDFLKIMREHEANICESPQQEALRNSLVLGILMKYSKVKELKSLRCVNKTVLIEANKELLKRDALEIRLKYYPAQNGFYRDSERALKPGEELIFRPEYSLDHLNYWLKSDFKPQIFCTSVTITNGDLGEIEPTFFFSKIGTYIKSLSLLSNSSEPTSKETFCSILMTCAAKLERLQISNAYAYQWDLQEESTLSLPSLKYFGLPSGGKDHKHFRKCLQTFKVILEAAPNLQFLENVTGNYLHFILANNIAHKVKELIGFGFPTNRFDVESFSRFASVSTPLKKFTVVHLNLGGQGVSQILDTSKETLEELEVEQDLFTDDVFHMRVAQQFQNNAINVVYPPAIQIPSFDRLRILKLFRVKTLNLHDNQREVEDRSRRRQGSTRIGEYPFLEKLSLGYCNPQLFSSHLPEKFMPNVTTLEIEDTNSETFVNNVSTLCPNVKNLTIISLNYAASWFENIYNTFQNLDTLTMKFSWVNNGKFDLDSLLTGIEPSVCGTYFSLEQDETVTDISELDKVRTKPWIGSIEGLQHLHIYFSELKSPLPRFSPDYRQSPRLTRVSGLYAFDLLPSLNVTLGYSKAGSYGSRVETAFESVAPHVTVFTFDGNLMRK